MFAIPVIRRIISTSVLVHAILEVLALSSRTQFGRKFPCVALHLLHLGTFVHFKGVFSGSLDKKIVAILASLAERSMTFGHGKALIRGASWDLPRVVCT